MTRWTSWTNSMTGSCQTADVRAAGRPAYDPAARTSAARPVPGGGTGRARSTTAGSVGEIAGRDRGGTTLLVAALRDLQWRRRRFLITVLGTALVFAMTLLLAGLSAAFDNEVDRTLTTTGADEWAISAGATGPFNSSAVMPDGALAAVRGTTGVQDADPFVAIGATIPGDTPKHVMMIGTVPGGVGSPTVDDGRAPRTAGE